MYKGNVIDCHVHVGDYNKLRDDIQELLMRNDKNRDFDLKKLFFEPDILGEYLEKSRVVKAMLLGEDGQATNYHITTEFVCNFKERASSRYKNMFVCLGSLNLKKESNPYEKYKSDVELGIKGYKLYPSDHNFDACDTKLMEVYENMEKNKHLLMFHTGVSAQRDSSVEFQNPKEYLEIVKSFPKLKIVFCHGGKKEYAKEMYSMMKEYENVYMDTGFVTAKYLVEMFPEIETVADRILFASDLPGGVRSLEQYIDEYRNLSVSDEIVEKILYSNACKLLEFMGMEG